VRGLESALCGGAGSKEETRAAVAERDSSRPAFFCVAKDGEDDPLSRTLSRAGIRQTTPGWSCRIFPPLRRCLQVICSC